MAGPLELDAYECDDIPEKFYRMTYPGSLPPDEDTGDYVSETNLEISDERPLKDVVEDHCHWRHVASPFISVLCDRDHAIKWAKDRVAKGKCRLDEIYISEIDTAKLPAGTRVFDATFLADTLDIFHPYSEDEYLVLHRIPCESVTSTRSLEQIVAADLAQLFAFLQVDDAVQSDTDEE